MNRFSRRIRVFLAQPRNADRVGLIAAAFLVGLTSVGYARLYKWAEHLATRELGTHPYWLMVAAPTCFVLGWYLVSVSGTRAAGSGIPQVMAAIELQEQRPEHRVMTLLLGMRVAVVKVVSSLLCVLGGGVVGREGPTLQVSASIFYSLGRRVRAFSSTLALDSWILAGAAAGMAAAFNTPLGGVVYAIEELASKHFSRVRVAVLTAVLVSGLVAQWLVGSYLYLGYPQVGRVGLSMIPGSLVVGVSGGALGGAFGAAIFKLQDWLRHHVRLRGITTGFAIAVLCGAALVLLRFVDERALGPGNRLVSDILAGNTVASAELVAVRFGSTVVSYLSGCAGGIFAPSLAIGASLGSWISSWWTGTNAVLFALLGMIAVLTGVTRAPFTSFVLMVEMTDRHSAIFPMMLTALAALGGARFFGSLSFYERSKRVLLSELGPRA
jgi:H+/Cl- antiporter ClcA